LYILPAARVHPVNVPLKQFLMVYSKWGEGAGALVAAMRIPQSQRQEREQPPANGT
jgi:xanthine dehydrogenase iron-sulfur cluster and FAD-binding subunit A